MKYNLNPGKKLEQNILQSNLYQLYQPNKMPNIFSSKISKSLEREEFKSSVKIEVVRSNQKFSPELEHYSFASSKGNNIQVTLIQNEEAKQAILTYTDMVNQENDIFVLYDAFNSFLNALKQLHLLYQKQAPSQLAAQINDISKGSLFWLKRVSDDTQWSGMKNLMSDKSRKKEDSFNDSRQVKQINVNVNQNSNPFVQNSLQSNASSVIDKLRREVGEMSEVKKVSVQTRVIQGKQIQVPIMSYETMVGILMDEKKQLFSIYQLQNKHYRTQMGFCLISKTSDLECRIQKLFIGKFYRKESYLHSIIASMIETLTNYKFMKISIKINSGQTELVKVLYQNGAKLKCEQVLLGNIKVFTFLFQKFGGIS